MKKLIAIALLLVLTSCEDPIRGGSIVGKEMKLISGTFEDTYKYYLQLKKGDRQNRVQVTEKAWNQAKDGMQWPFEVK